MSKLSDHKVNKASKDSEDTVLVNVEDFSKHLQRIYDISYALATTKDIPALLEHILKEAIELTQADGGTIYLVSEDKKSLLFKVFFNHTLNIYVGNNSGKELMLPSLPLYKEDGTPNNSGKELMLPSLSLYKEDGTPNSEMVAAYCAIQKTHVNVIDVYHTPGFDFSGTRRFDKMTGYRSKSLLTVPLINHDGQVVGVMQLLNKKTDTHETTIFTSLDELITKSLSAQAVVAVVRMMLLEQQQILKEGHVSNFIDLKDYSEHLKQIYQVSYALATTKDVSALLEYILKETIELTRADGGTIYLLTEDQQTLKFEILFNRSLNIHTGGTSGSPITLSPLQLYKDDGTPNNSMVAAYCAVEKKQVNIADAYSTQGFDFSGTRNFDKKMGYHSKSFLTVPLVDHEGDLVGVMQLLNKKNDIQEIIEFTELDELITQTLSSQAAVAIVRMQLIEQQQFLFEAFIKLINTAIDEKSIHTAGHCQRVPVIAMMLANALNEIDHGPFSDFHLDEKSFYELEIAALLHDCGKITTPVHVVEKRTKLETITDRIETIKTRFQLLKLQNYCDCLEAKLAQCISINSEEEARIETEYTVIQEQIEKDMDLVSRSNTGSEKMDEHDIDELSKIRARHQITDDHGVEQYILSQDELKNLMIRYGTLTDDERQIINYHITSTINMLEALPWPKNLCNVPEFAGGHHERMDGKGYPRGIKAGTMSVQARLMALADIFEALTAPDRPYKKGLKLSQALTIMGNMTKGGHLDPDIFQVFIEKRVYLQYAKEFLADSQWDEVDPLEIPAYVPKKIEANEVTH